MTKKPLFTAVALLLLTLAAGCGPKQPETIKIGLLLDLSGDLAPMGTKMLDSAVLAVEEINAAGGVSGKQVELIVEDGKTDPAMGLQRVKKMVEIDGVEVIVGPMITGASELAIAYAKEHRVSLITMSATASKLSDMDGTEWFFRTCLTDDDQGQVLASVVMKNRYTRLASIVLDNLYGRGVERALIESLRKSRWQGEVVARVHYNQAKKDYLTELEQIKGSNPDAVLAVTYAHDGIVLFKQALEMGLDNIAWLGCDGNYGSGLLREPKSAEFMEKAIVAGTRTVGSGSTYEQFVAKYTERFGQNPEIYCDTTYDAVRAVAMAIEAAGIYDGEAIRNTLTELGFQGASGPITFDERGDRASGTFELWKVVKDPTTETGYKNMQIELVTTK